MSHFIVECQYGKVHSQCRCPHPSKSVVKVVCQTPEAHKPSQTQTLHSRLYSTVESYLGHTVMPIVIQSLVDSLEGDVKDWLSDNAKEMK